MRARTDTVTAGTAPAGSPAGTRAAGTRPPLEDNSVGSGDTTVEVVLSTPKALDYPAGMMGWSTEAETPADRAKADLAVDTAAPEGRLAQVGPMRRSTVERYSREHLYCKWETELMGAHNWSFVGFEGYNHWKGVEESGLAVM